MHAPSIFKGRTGIALILITLFVAACSGGPANAPDEPTTESATAPQQARDVLNDEVACQVARVANLVCSGRSWTVSSSFSDTGNVNMIFHVAYYKDTSQERTWDVAAKVNVDVAANKINLVSSSITETTQAD